MLHTDPKAVPSGVWLEQTWDLHETLDIPNAYMTFEISARNSDSKTVAERVADAVGIIDP